VTTATNGPTPPKKHLQPGQINLDWIPTDWALTPLQGKKAYKPGWTTNPYSISQVRAELEEGRATGVGLLCGQFSNEYGLIFVDIDGEEAVPLIEQLGGGPLDAIFPPTLTISSGLPGKQRMLFRVPGSKVKLIPNKATLKIPVNGQKGPWELLWRTRQGCIMGAHPSTDGYYNTIHGGFEFASNLPEMPEWLYQAISKAYPTHKYRKDIKKGSQVALTQNINIQYEEDSSYFLDTALKEAKQYLAALSQQRADDYEEWIGVGMCLHQIDDSLLTDWINWSAQSPSFQDGVCEQKWDTFERLPGGPNAEGARGLNTLQAMAKEDGWIDFGGFEVPTTDPSQLHSSEEDAILAMLNEGYTALAEAEDEEDFDSDEGVGNNTYSLNSLGSQKNPPRKQKNPPSSEIANFLFPLIISGGWRFDPQYQVFMRYNKHHGIWEREAHFKDFYCEVQFLLENLNLPNGYTANLIGDIVELLRGHLIHPYWNDDVSKLAFTNGVLELDTGEFTEHNQENYITWGLDFEYDPTSDPGPIVEWLNRTQYNDEGRVQVLRAWLRACLVGKGNEIQRFLELIGPGGRGKSTFANLCCAFVGAGNYASTTLIQLEQSRFEGSTLKDKRLTLINDSERYGGSAQTFKALTGGDPMRYEEKMKAVNEPFVYTGMVMVVANEPIQTTDNTSGLSRRRLTIEFNRPLYKKGSEAKDMIKIQRGRVSGEWKDYLPGLVNWVLQMTEKEMRQYLLDTNEMVPSLKRIRNHILLNSNNLIEWLQAEVVFDNEHVSSVGKKIPAPKDSNTRYYNANSHLYPSYCEYCESTGSKSIGQKRFISLLLDCCNNQLGLKEVRSFSNAGRHFIKGLAVRASDNKFSKYETILPEGKEQV